MTISPFALVKRFARENRGAAFVEYALLAGLVAAIVIAAVAIMSPGLTGLFTGINTALDTTTTQIPTPTAPGN